MNYQSIPLIGSALLLSTLSANGQKKNTQPNILFILCDDMGYGDLGCYGQPFIRTPHIDAMAGEGMRFTQAYAGSPVSAPSRASFMTGQHSGHCEVRGNKEYWKNAPIVEYGQNKEYSIVGQHPYDPDHVILPEIMKDNGYTTGMFGKWAGGYEGSCSTPDKRGIDEYYGYICQFQAHLYYPNFLNRYSKALGDTGVVRVVMDENIQYPMYGPDYLKRPQYSADMIHQKALEWLDQQDGKQPFFGVLTYTLPHAELVQPEDSILNEYKAKFNPDKEFKGSEGSRYNAITHTHAQFAGMITRLDYYVGEVLKKLKEKGLDGICLSAIIGGRFDGKIRYLVNDLLLYLSNLRSIFVPINKHGAQGKKNAELIEKAYASDNQIITFPAGLCSRKQNGKIQDTEWKKSFIQKAVEYRRDIVPVFFEGRNSNFFYRLANMRKALGIKMNYEMIYLPDEMFKSKHKTYSIHFGKPIPWQTFDSSRKPAEWAEWVKEIVYNLKK